MIGSSEDLLPVKELSGSTCFGVGGDEKVCRVGSESPDGVPVVGNAVHEGNSSDWDGGETGDGGDGLQNGFAVGQFFFPRHDGYWEASNVCWTKIKKQ